MNTAIYSASGGSAGVGFAIPVDTLKSVVTTIIAEGKVVRPALGLSYLDGAQARAIGFVSLFILLRPMAVQLKKTCRFYQQTPMRT